jgi:homoserine O-acetyltransferase
VSRPRAFPLGELRLDGGPVLAEATLGYRVWGRLDAAGSNAILLPGQFPGMGEGWARLIGPGRVLDPERHFIVSVDLLGDGLSSAPSQTLTEESRAAFASVTMLDNLRAQRRLVSALGVTRLRLVAGWSIAGAQAIAWAAVYPEAVGAVLAVCAASGPAPERAGLLARLLDILEGRGGAGRAPGPRLRAFGGVLADWVHSPAYYAGGLFRDDGFASIEQAREAWELAYLARDPADLAVALRCWAGAGSARPGAPGRIRARAILMACDSDRWCPPREVAREAALIPGAEARLIRSPFGHAAGRPGAYAEETALVERALGELLG